jgi:hypothetical protein
LASGESIAIAYLALQSFGLETRPYYVDRILRKIIYNLDKRYFSRWAMDDFAKQQRNYEEVVRLMNEIVALLKENNTMLRQHNRTVDNINERVRKIGINTSNLR